MKAAPNTPSSTHKKIIQPNYYLKAQYEKLNFAVSALMAFATTAASASVILHGTRIVYPSNSKDVTIVAENNGEQPALVQAWLDNGSDPANLDKDEVPLYSPLSSA